MDKDKLIEIAIIFLLFDRLFWIEIIIAQIFQIPNRFLIILSKFHFLVQNRPYDSTNKQNFWS
jgi:hypothetical protein